jgi:hypothetical protein
MIIILPLLILVIISSVVLCYTSMIIGTIFQPDVIVNNDIIVNLTKVGVDDSDSWLCPYHHSTTARKNLMKIHHLSCGHQAKWL